MNGPALGQACPTRDELARFRRGDLPLSKLDALADHFDHCGDCQASLLGLPDESDELLSDLRRVRELENHSWHSEMAALEASSAEVFADTRPDRHMTFDGPGIPDKIGEYHIVAPFGRGGMGTVYRALHARLEKVVAIKVMSRDRLGDATATARFQREMKAVGKLNHPNIVLATDAGEVDGAPFLVMEFADGIDLARLIKRHGTLPVCEACELARQAALGLQYAHSHGLVHRDIKPSNLLLMSAPDLPARGLVKVADLGLALLCEGETEKPGCDTSANVVIGSLDYMAPEQADDAHQVDHRADLYSLGCTLYELLAGKPPFAVEGRQSRLQKLKAHAQTSVSPLRTVRPEIALGLDAIVQRLLAKIRSGFTTAAELTTALQPFAAGANLGRLLDETSPETGLRYSVSDPAPA